SRSTMQGIDVSLQRTDSPNLPCFRHTVAHETEALARSDPRGPHLYGGFRTVQRRANFERPVHQRRPAAAPGKLSRVDLPLNRIRHELQPSRHVDGPSHV